MGEVAGDWRVRGAVGGRGGRVGDVEDVEDVGGRIDGWLRGRRVAERKRKGARLAMSARGLG